MAGYIRFSPLSPGVEDPHFLSGLNMSNVTGCPGGVTWIYTVVGDCVRTPREIASAYLGIASLVTWIGVSLPQIIKNFRNLDGMAGVSFFLIAQWSTGDATNLVGSLLTNQLRFQIALACYFMVSDATQICQFSMYRYRKWKREKKESKVALPGQNTSQLVLCLMGLFAVSHTLFSVVWSSSDVTKASRSQHHHSRSLLSVHDDSVLLFSPEHNMNNTGHMTTTDDIIERFKGGDNSTAGKEDFWHNTVDIVGYVIGVISSIFYLGSRIAQIIKNVQIQSTDGIAFMTFFLAVIGNITYGGQIVVRSLETEFLLEKTPWLVGSFGVIGLDLTLLCQFRYYKNKEPRDESRKPLLPAPNGSINTDQAEQIDASKVSQDDVRFNGYIP